ncbi:MAG: RloB domain-containing protein, partial [Pseudanabaena sp.]
MIKISRTKILDRKQDLRSPKLFVIATEGEKTESQYFGLFESSRIKLKFLPTEDGRSAPQHVIERLNKHVIERLNIFQEEYGINDDDMFWLVID